MMWPMTPRAEDIRHCADCGKTLHPGEWHHIDGPQGGTFWCAVHCPDDRCKEENK